MHEQWNGRVEDPPLVRGRGHYGDDIRPPDVVFACFVRSPYAFAKIRGMNVSAARKAAGVRAVYTAADFASDNLGTVSQAAPFPGKGGRKAVSPFRPALASDRVHHVGEAVVLVVADSREAAADAAELVEVDYQPLTPVTDARQALGSDAPQIWPQAPGNVAFDWSAPADEDGSKLVEIERIIASVPHVARIELFNQRLVTASLEPRVATASYDPASGEFTLRCGSQGVAQIRGQIIAALQVKPEQIRIITDVVGGGFGMKASTYPEYIALLCAARKLGCPIHWAASRSESFMSDNQGRDSYWKAEIALDTNGRFLALGVDGIANIGAFMTLVAHLCSTTHISGCLPSVYDIPKMHIRTRCVFTNTVPIGPYRGAGRPEANYLLERLIDVAAQVTGIDTVELRRRNLIAAERMPYETANGNIYDSGEFQAIFEKAVDLADYNNFSMRRKRSEKAGKLRGIGIGCFLEIAGAFPEEAATIAFPGGAIIEIGIGTSPSGQGQETVFRHVAAKRLGVPDKAVIMRFGDSKRDVPGFGAVASRSAAMVGGAIARTIEDMLVKARKVAALLLQAKLEAVEYHAGSFRVMGSDRSISLFEAAERTKELVRQGVVLESLDTKGVLNAPPTFPNGCHIAEVEIDPETGAVSMASYTAVDDCGRVLDSVIVTGQIHGGVAQGLGQALLENTVYDPDSGQLLSGSFMDYALPRADVMPVNFISEHLVVPCRTNPLGVKGTGEAGTTAAPCAIMNAIASTLSPEAAMLLEMPATPERIWRALHRSGISRAHSRVEVS